MSISKRWRPVFSLFVLVILLLIAIQPVAASPKAPALSHKGTTVTAKHGTSLRHAVTSTTLREMSAKAQTAQADTSDRKINGKVYNPANKDARYIDLYQNRRIPHTVTASSSTAGLSPVNAPQMDASRPVVAPDRAHYTDEPMPNLYSYWEGLNQGSNRTNFTYGFLPSDVNGDTSGNVYDNGFYVQTVNGNMAVWDYSRTNVYDAWPRTVVFPTPINVLFSDLGGACADTNDGDPVVLYDDTANRWLVSQFALPYFDFTSNPYPDPFYECIAISQTDDPTGLWNLYEFGGLFTDMNDYPKFGIWQDGYYMTVNQFDKDTSGWQGAGVMVFNRDQMLTGAVADWVYFDPYTGCVNGNEDVCYLGGMLPADADGSLPTAGTPGYVVQFDDDAWGYSGDQLEVWTVNVDWVTPANSTMIHTADLPVDAFDSQMCGYGRSCIPQPGTSVGLDAIADRLMHRLQWRDFGTYSAMVTNHTVDVNGNDHAGIRWYELRNEGNGWYVYQQGTYAPDADNRWMGSIAMDAVGDIALGYSVSGPNTYPSIRYAGRLASDPLGTLPRTEKGIANGGGSQTSTASRWGDYSSMSVSPDGCDFVYTNQYLRGTTPAEWYTRMGNFGFDACWSQDTASPDTTIDSTDITGPIASFTFSATEPGSTFMCALDAGAYTACTSPQSYTGLKLGLHAFRVYATDSVGNIDWTPATVSWLATRSLGRYDGWELESRETSDTAGSENNTAATLYVGDNSGDKQYRSILHFNTTLLPDTAVISKATVRVKKAGLVGTDPFTTHGNLSVDIKTGSFSGNPALQLADFNAAASMSIAGTVPNSPVSGWYSSVLDAGAFSFVNKTGPTQFRLRFDLDDNDDMSADYVKFYSGDTLTLGNRPLLIIEFTLP